jgi:protein-S-isoprenylcysteine O-methyltransferase Ste14
MNPQYALIVLLAGWVVWVASFVRARKLKTTEPAKIVDRRARWGIALAGIGYGLLMQGRWWERDLTLWRLPFAVVFLALACVLAWTGTRALGRHWRIDAGLSADHELIMSGPYRMVRHPIYASMLFMFLGMGTLMTPPLLFAIATVFFLVGTEIRVHVEESLLASRFGDTFVDYKRRVPAYIPFVR